MQACKDSIKKMIVQASVSQEDGNQLYMERTILLICMYLNI